MFFEYLDFPNLNNPAQSQIVQMQPTRPHLCNLVLEVLHELNLDFHHDHTINNDNPSLHFVTAQELQKMTEQEQFEMAATLNINANGFDECDLNMFSGQKQLNADDAQMTRMLRAVNWARHHGGTVTISVCTYTTWLDIWIQTFESIGDLCDIIINQNTEFQSFRNWIDTKARTNNNLLTSEKLQIGGNSGARCWFLSVFYSLLGINTFWLNLFAKRDISDGHLLLYKLGLNLKLAVMQQNTGALELITQFCEAFLQGHFCHWDDYGSIESAFRILYRMTDQDNFFQEFEVRCTSWRNCVSHQDFDNHFHVGWNLSFYMPITWDQNTGYICAQMSSNKRCPDTAIDGSLCPLRTNHKIFYICNSAQDNFVLSCEHGIPQNMWLWLLRHDVIKIGEHYRKIDIGIFLINGNHFVSAYLINNNSQALNANKKKWIKFETQNSEISSLGRGVNRTNLKYLFVSKAPKNCLNCVHEDNVSMIACIHCGSLYHQSCVDLESDNNNELVYLGDDCKSQHCLELSQDCAEVISGLF
ncbi:MAG: hypothetical protein GY941_24720 [Planctomycetes bacterium]|nr:hypothetical protein [Planctomycetota bacterium]